MSMFATLNAEDKEKGKITSEPVQMTIDQKEEAPKKRRGRPPKAEGTTAKRAAKKKSDTEDTTDSAVSSDPSTEEAPKKRGGRKKKSDTEGFGSDSSGAEKGSVEGQLDFKANIEVEYLREALGVSPSVKELYAEYIASKAPDAMSKSEEIEAIGEEAMFAKGTSIYHRTRAAWDPEQLRFRALKPGATPPGDQEVVDGAPFVYDYQWRGFFKEAFSFMQRSSKNDGGNANVKFNLTNHKKIVDGEVFIHPRKICLNIPETSVDVDGITEVESFNEDGTLKTLQRSLRTSGPSGERVAIASSEMVPKGTSMKLTISVTDKRLWPAVESALNYGLYHGFSGWRNSGLGIFRWRKLDSNFLPIEGSDWNFVVPESCWED